MTSKTSTKFDYYAWQTGEVRLFGEQIPRCAKSGMAAAESADPANLLLAESVQINQGDHVLALNCSAGLVGVVATRESNGGQIWLADTNVVATEAARRTLKANDVKGVGLFTSSGTKHLPAQQAFDVVTVRLPKGKQLAIQHLLDGYHALRPGGRLYFAGANDEGIKTHLRNLDLLFGSSLLLGFRKGCRVAMATKPEVSGVLPELFSASWLDHSHVDQFEAERVHKVAGRQLLICSRPGVFAGTKLDRGTAALLDQMTIERTDRVLDLGCGNGILGAVAAVKASMGSVVLLDGDINAVDAARQTLSANELANCEVLLSDGITQLGSATTKAPFDVVVSNPPFHQGKNTHHDVGRQFIADAAAVLKPGGRLLLVANQFLKYEERFKAHFGNCETLSTDGSFKVLMGVKNSAS